MYKRYDFAILLVLLFLSSCNPAGPAVAETPTLLSPTMTAGQTSTPVATSTPVNTSTPVPETAASNDSSTTGLTQPTIDLAAQSAVVMDAATGDILYEKNAHQRMFPASTTKMMTALLALEYFSLDEIIRVGEESNLAWTQDRMNAQKAGLFYGQELAMKELLYGLMLTSGSDAAFTIAANVARVERGEMFMDDEQALAHFADLMNRKASAIGAVETNFTNPDGMQDPNHYTSASDLALIAQYAMQDPRFRELVATTAYQTAETVTRTGDIISRFWENTNRLIQPQDEHYYASANGIKTGTTAEAGFCLVSSASFGDTLVIAVVLGSTEEGVWTDSIRLLEFAKDNLS